MNGRYYRTLLVTGAGGFVGKHLIELWRSTTVRQDQIVGLDLRVVDNVSVDHWQVCDLTDAQSVNSAIEKWKPDGIVHLAGITGRGDPQIFFHANVLSCENLLSAASRLPSPPRILLMGSAAEYGIPVGVSEVVNEQRPLLGRTLYGVSKIFQEQWGLAYWSQGLLPVVCMRPFNIIGPGQSPSLVPATFMEQLAMVQTGQTREICVGNLASWRDFTDVRDVVRATNLLLHASDDIDGQVFNIASGRGTSIGELLDLCVSLAGRDIAVREDPARVKDIDVGSIVGDASKLHLATGWRPSISLEQSLTDMWRCYSQ